MGVYDWKTAPGLNGDVDKVVSASDGTAGKQFPGALRGIMAGVASLNSDQGGALVTTGTGNAYVVSTSSGVTPKPGVRVSFWADRANTAEPTLNIDGSGPRRWRGANGDPLSAGAVQRGLLYTVAWAGVLGDDAAEWRMVGAGALTSGDLTNSSGVLSLVVQGTQDGRPTLDQQSAIQAAWEIATALGLPLQLTPGPNVNGILDVRISRGLRAPGDNARLRTDGRVRLHGYASEFTSEAEGVPGTEAAIATRFMVYFGPTANKPVSARLAGAAAERITCVFHPPVDANGVRIASRNTVYGVYFDRCDAPRARQIDVSRLNAGYPFGFASCRDIDFDGLTLHDCAMVLNTASTDPIDQNKQLSGINADDGWAGRGIDPTIGGFVRNVVVYGLTSNRTAKQVDGISDQGTRGVVWDGIVVRDCDEGLDTFATGSTYANLDFSGNTCDVKCGHGANGNTISGRGRYGSSAMSDGRAAILLFSGNRGNTARNAIAWELVGYTGTRLVEVGGDNAGAVSSSGATITTKVVDCVVSLTARSCQSLRLMGEGVSTGTGNVVNIDIDEASIASTPAGSEQEYLQASSNAGTRITVLRGSAKRPVALTKVAARTQGASYATGYYRQDTGAFVPMVGWDEFDAVHGQTGTGLLRRKGAADYEFLAYAEGTWTPTLLFATPATGTAYAVQSARYVKVGKLVTVQGRLTLTSKGTGGAGLARIEALPFAGAASSSIGVPRYSNAALPAGYLLNGYVDGVRILLQGVNNASAIDAQFENIGNDFDVMFSFSYIAAA